MKGGGLSNKIDSGGRDLHRLHKPWVLWKMIIEGKKKMKPKWLIWLSQV